MPEKKHPRTVRYHRERNQFMRDILAENTGISLKGREQPFCQICGRPKMEVSEMNIEHPNGDGSSYRDDEGNKIGGLNLFYKYREDFDEGKSLLVVCVIDHFLLHKSRGDGHGTKLIRKDESLEEYRDISPEEAEEVLRDRLSAPVIEEFPEGGEYEPVELDYGRENQEDIRHRIMRIIPRDELVSDEYITRKLDEDVDAIMEAIDRMIRDGDIYRPKKKKLMRP